MKQRLKKYNVPFLEAMAAFRAKPESEESESESSSSSDSSVSSESESEGEEEEGGPGAGGADGGVEGEGFERVKSKSEKRRELAADPKDITFEMVAKKLKEIILTRGKKGTDRHDQVEALAYLATVAKSPSQCVEIHLQLVSAMFDTSPSLAAHMPAPMWRRCVATLLHIFELLEAAPAVLVDETAETSERTDAEDAAALAAGECRIWGNLVAFVERIDDELFKSLQVIDPHTREYVERMKDELGFLALAQTATHYLTAKVRVAGVVGGGGRPLATSWLRFFAGPFPKSVR